MSIDSFAVFIPYTGGPLRGDTAHSGVADPYLKGVDPLAFFAIDNWSMDVEQTLNIGSQSSGAGAGKISFNPLSITRKMDKASPILLKQAASGTPFKFVDLIEDRRNDNRLYFVAWRFSLVAVKTISWTPGADQVVENVTLEYGGLAIEYFPLNPDGSVGTPVVAGWDAVLNVSAPPTQPS